jgi:hypothetical protein
VDEDDESLSVDISKRSDIKKKDDEAVITGSEYNERLRQKYGYLAKEETF